MDRARRLLLGLAGLAGGGALLQELMRSAAQQPPRRSTFEVVKTDAQWREVLTPAQFGYCARRAPSIRSPARSTAKARRHLRLRRLRAASLLVRDQVRQPHRLAQFLEAAGQRRGGGVGRDPGHEAGGNPLPPLRRPLRPRLRGRAAADRPALLHERAGDGLHTTTRRPHHETQDFGQRRHWAGKDFVWLAASLVAGIALYFSGNLFAESAFKIPPPTLDMKAAVEAACPAPTACRPAAGHRPCRGCFWGVQGVFQHTRRLPGVSGYAGGQAETASYDKVTTDTTGDPESVQVTFDPALVCTASCCRFSSPWFTTRRTESPGSRCRQHYRSAIFYADEQQQQVAEKYIAQLNEDKAYREDRDRSDAPGFYPAEGYHQDYTTLHPQSGYIIAFDLPKVPTSRRCFRSGTE